jgi:hypothetical protein
LIHDQLDSWTDWLQAVNSKETISRKVTFIIKIRIKRF